MLHNRLRIVCGLLALAAGPGCRDETETSQPAAPAAPVATPRQQAADHLDALAADAAQFGEATAAVKAFAAQLRTDAPIPPSIVVAWYSHGPAGRTILEFFFYDESQSIRGFRVKAAGGQRPASYDYLLYQEGSRNNRPLENVVVEVSDEAPTSDGPVVTVPIRKVPGGGTRAWIPLPARGATATLCLIDAERKESGCAPLKERPAPNSQPASQAP